MPFALIVIGLIMIVTGARGTYRQFAAQITADFTGPGNFLYWIIGLGVVGAVGYIDSLRTFSRLFMTLILISMVLANQGFFAKLQQAINSGPAAPDAVAETSPKTSGTNIPSPFDNSPSGGNKMFERPLIDAGPLGTLDPSTTPGSWADTVRKWFGK